MNASIPRAYSLAEWEEQVQESAARNISILIAGTREENGRPTVEAMVSSDEENGISIDLEQFLKQGCPSEGEGEKRKGRAFQAKRAA